MSSCCSLCPDCPHPTVRLTFQGLALEPLLENPSPIFSSPVFGCEGQTCVWLQCSSLWDSWYTCLFTHLSPP